MAEAKKIISARREEMRKLVYAALCLALAYLLPFLTANNRALNTAVSPMHIPAFLCGFLCGPGWGAAVGFCAPLLRSMTIQMPPVPMSIYMAFELAAYGFVSGLLSRLFPKKLPWLYVSLVIAMIAGRIVYCAVFAAYTGEVVGAQAFFALLLTQFANTWIGILIHLALIPPIVAAVERYRRKNP